MRSRELRFDKHDVHRFRPFWGVGDFERNTVSFTKVSHFNAGKVVGMKEYVFSSFRRSDKSETSLINFFDDTLHVIRVKKINSF